MDFNVGGGVRKRTSRKAAGGPLLEEDVRTRERTEPGVVVVLGGAPGERGADLLPAICAVLSRRDCEATARSGAR